MNDITINKTPMEQFQEKIMAKLRDDIGAMLPPEVLQSMVERAVEEQFFKERRIPQRFSSDEIKPSWFVEEVAKEAQPLIREMVTEHVQKNRAQIEQGIRAFLDDQNLLLVSMSIVRAEFQMMMNDQIQQMLARFGQH